MRADKSLQLFFHSVRVEILIDLPSEISEKRIAPDPTADQVAVNFLRRAVDGMKILTNRYDGVDSDSVGKKPLQAFDPSALIIGNVCPKRSDLMLRMDTGIRAAGTNDFHLMPEKYRQSLLEVVLDTGTVRLALPTLERSTEVTEVDSVVT